MVPRNTVLYVQYFNFNPMKRDVSVVAIFLQEQYPSCCLRHVPALCHFLQEPCGRRCYSSDSCGAPPPSPVHAVGLTRAEGSGCPLVADWRGSLQRYYLVLQPIRSPETCSVTVCTAIYYCNVSGSLIKSPTTRDHSKQDQLLLIKIANFVGFCVQYRRWSYLVQSPVIQRLSEVLEGGGV